MTDKTLKWTPAQLSAIETRDTNVLVSAGAGSGKTAALIERIYRLIADPDTGTTLEDMLIVTFTRAAAAEMRQRLAARLNEEIQRTRIRNAPDESARRTVRHLENQLAILPRARISTLHSFCLTLLKEFAEESDLPPDFDLMEEDEAWLLRGDHIQAEVEAVLNHPEDGPVLREILCQITPLEGAEQVARITRSIHAFLEALPDPTQWVTHALGNYTELLDEKCDLTTTHYAGKLTDLLTNTLNEARRAYQVFLKGLTPQDLPKPKSAARKRYDEASEAVVSIDRLLSTLAPDTAIPDFKQLLNIGRAPSAASLSRDEELVRDRLPGLRDRLNALRKATEHLQPGLTIRAECGRIASQLPYVRLFLQRLGLQLSENILDEFRDQRRLTFSALERLALRLLRTSGHVSTLMRERFNHVLVDEYQDVNALQAELLAAVSRPAPAGNQFVVGDVKQSIYGFRQADPGRFLTLASEWPPLSERVDSSPGVRISLRENFRSAPALLREMNVLFADLITPRLGGITYDDEHRLVPGKNDDDATDTRIHLHLLEGGPASAFQDDDESDGDNDLPDDTYERESRHVVSIIKGIGPPWKRFAVLLRSASGTVTKLAEEFARADVPCHTQESLGFLEQQEVLDFLCILRTIINPWDEVALVGCLRGPAADWTENDIALLRLEDREAPLFDIIKRLAPGDSPLNTKCADLIARIRDWQHASAREPMARLFTLITHDLMLRERVAVLPKGDARVGNLDFLRQRASQFDAFRRKGVAHFLAFLEDLLERNKDLGQPPPAMADEDVVRIMTIHKSKGLEFDFVIIPFLGKDFNFRDAEDSVVWDREEGFAVRFLPDTRYGQDVKPVAKRSISGAVEARLRSEEVRLLYVAMTRARERLHLTGSARKLRDHVSKFTGSEVPVVDPFKSRNSLDWILHALAKQGKLSALLEERDTVGELFRVTFGSEPDADEHQDNGTDQDIADEQIQRLRDRSSDVREMLEQVSRIHETPRSAPLRAKLSATEAKRRWETIHSDLNPPWEPAREEVTAETPEWWPTSLTREGDQHPASGRQAGTVTHRACALMDLDALAEGRTVSDELDRMVHEKLFTSAEAHQIRTDDLQAFFSDDPLGRRILASRFTVCRELPFTLRVPHRAIADEGSPASPDLIFQGVVDLVFNEEQNGGIVVVDFKTDWWDGTMGHFDRLEATYTPQIILYRAAIEKSLRRPVTDSWLHFLHARHSIGVEPEHPGQWLEYLRAAYRNP